MLDFAQNHEKELEKKMRDTWGKEKYWYYHRCSYFSPQVIKEDTWTDTQFVSLNSAGEVTGYLGYGIDRECRYVTYLAIINFTDDISFGSDVMKMVKDIFEVYRYRKIVFTVVVGNPVEQKYDRLTVTVAESLGSIKIMSCCRMVNITMKRYMRYPGMITMSAVGK